MNADLDALATTLYVTIDDLLINHPELVPEQPVVGLVPKLCDAELGPLSSDADSRLRDVQRGGVGSSAGRRA